MPFICESETAAFYGMKQQEKLICFSCKNEGHNSVDCPTKEKKQHGTSANVAGSTERPSICFVGVHGAEPQKKQRWVSGFSIPARQIGRDDKDLFTEVHRLPKPAEIAVAKDDHLIVAEHVGTVKMTSVVNRQSIECTVKNVLFTPQLRHNLLSVVRIEEAGMRIVFDNMKALVHR